MSSLGAGLSQDVEDAPARSGSNGDTHPVALLAWLVLAWTLMVILYGAWVRITGSGAGCGQHWPTCHGEIMHRPASTQTAIELTHRVTSAIDGLLVLGLAIVLRRRKLGTVQARWFAVAAVLFVIMEGLLGAALVRLELVGDNASMARAWVMSLHLVNTSLLIGAQALCAWALTQREPNLHAEAQRLRWPLIAGVVALMILMMYGAVTALGDTLFPVDPTLSKADVLARAGNPTAHFLQRVRIIHPVSAVVVGLYLFALAGRVRDRCQHWNLPSHARDEIAKLTMLVRVLVFAQVCGGVVNIALSAPGWMQIVHLGMSSMLWLAVVLATASVLRPQK